MALTLDDKPWWVGLIVGIILAVGILYAVESFLVKDIKQDIAKADGQIVELDRKIQQGRAAEQKLPQFREEVKRLELELEKLRRILPSTRNTEEIIKKIKSLVDQGEFTLHRLSFPPLGAPSADPYVEWPIAVSVDGRYHDLAILFNRLGNFSRIMNVENINITALGTQETKTVASQFTAKTFVYVEPASTEAKPGGN
ncbi:MAG TPA: type 4a pilus biogenesis protein PilO [Thermoanaerobaculia bacterium]|jgi:type IV pilus assembly protein PilO|nr:type 4a pilus biogenesis protein PilO [Thermoanaerobaculia bacterium]